MKEAKKKYGLLTGIAMVIGTVVGAGVFIKGADVLKVSGGSLSMSLLAWLIGGLIMVVSAFCFAVYSTRVVKFNGCVDYVEHATNDKVGYFFGYYLAKIYFPIFASIVAIISAKNLVAAFIPDAYTEYYWMCQNNSYVVILVAIGLLTIFFLLNYFAPRIANKFQISVLFIKLAPILIVALAGVFASFINGAPGIINAFKEVSPEGTVNSFGEAIKITSFAYDGWVCVTALNAEMRDSKKNMPKAIIIGTVSLVVFYLIYFIGASAIVGNAAIINQGDFAGLKIFATIFANAPIFGETVFLLFLFLSCAGNVNAMIFCTSRSLIALAYRDNGFRPKQMMMTRNDRGDYGYLSYLLSYLFSLLFIGIWALAFNNVPFFEYLKDMDTITCSLLYGMFIAVYINIIRSFKEENVVVRFIMPILAIAGSVFFCLCGMGIYQLLMNGDTRPLISFACTMTLNVILMVPSVIFYYNKKGMKKNEK